MRRATQGRVESDFGGQITMTIEDYEAVGGLANALSNHVERIYQRLPDAACKRIAETAFRNLTEITPDGHVVRRPARLSEICAVADASREQVVPVLDEFRAEGRSFLVPPISEPLDPEKVIDISHESLIRQWRSVRGLDERRGRKPTRLPGWSWARCASGRRAAGTSRALLSELRTLEAEEWAKTHPHQVQPEERDFLKASRDQLDREARRWRVVSRVFGALAVVFLILAVVFFQALRRTSVAERDAIVERDRAKTAEDVATKEADRSKNLLRQNLETRACASAVASRRLLEEGNPAVLWHWPSKQGTR